MKTKYLLSALVATAFGSGAVMADTYSTQNRTGWDGQYSHSYDADHMRSSDVGTGEGYTALQIQEARGEWHGVRQVDDVGTGEGYTAEQLKESRGVPTDEQRR